MLVAYGAGFILPSSAVVSSSLNRTDAGPGQKPRSQPPNLKFKVMVRSTTNKLEKQNQPKVQPEPKRPGPGVRRRGYSGDGRDSRRGAGLRLDERGVRKDEATAQLREAVGTVPAPCDHGGGSSGGDACASQEPPSERRCSKFSWF